ncbi:hypothetical protein OTU49_013550, partial [Cherax quadricarinatus]
REHLESETDMDEFEKVGVSGGSDGAFSPMEALPDASRNSMKTKHHYSVQVNESKHIKLDGGHGGATSPASSTNQEELSYTESGGTAASGSRHPAALVKTHHVVTAELQQQLEDKNTAIIILQ